eukprot:GDKI01019733.1.p2 GENE.GDKI01019733.1~~GDKI01019733.1.p2  ORF type:complete len:123 (+),score=28.32 GDKI01019733.1:131-499(+)
MQTTLRTSMLRARGPTNTHMYAPGGGNSAADIWGAYTHAHALHMHKMDTQQSTHTHKQPHELRGYVAKQKTNTLCRFNCVDRVLSTCTQNRVKIRTHTHTPSQKMYTCARLGGRNASNPKRT